ncbi:MAG: hypothetical protein EOP09_03690 [Proteobacteria bacterium]|nr:MAG: hypothetical protein EOP09_03690 [Pseudomonadota bacterium]
MGTQRTEWKFLITTAFIVATIAVPTLASLLGNDGQDSAAMALRPQEQKMREPASVPSITKPSKALVINDAAKELNNLVAQNEISFDFQCKQKKALEFKVQGSYVQLKGHDCDKKGPMPKLKVTNKTNGFTASVFVMNGKQYQTDLIQLKPGENQIHLQYEHPTGQLEEHVLNVKSGAI